jgi:hypothetical protein
MGGTKIPCVVRFSNDYMTALDVILWLVTVEPFKPALRVKFMIDQVALEHISLGVPSVFPR